jgi:hypothetical protein
MSTAQSNFSFVQKQALTNSVVQLKTGSGLTELWGWNIINTNAAIAYIQLFNAANTGDVTLGTTVADFYITVPSGVGIQNLVMLDEKYRLTFSLGLCAAATTTLTGNAALGSAMSTTWMIK